MTAEIISINMTYKKYLVQYKDLFKLTKSELINTKMQK